METLKNTEIQKALTSFPMESTSKYHKELVTKFESVDANTYKLNNDAKALMTFNGVYALDVAKGAFLAVDTNMHMKKGATKPIYDVSLIISMDGITSQRFPFTGTFDGVTLKQTSEAELGLNLSLIFTREDNNNGGVTASFVGSITLPLPGKTAKLVLGTTYNNPIKYEIYQGTYYEVIPANKKDNTPEKTVKVLDIDTGYKISFDYGANNGELTKVPSFTYNLNMYFFSFSKGIELYHLIMGTGAAKGLVAGNMTITKPPHGEKTIISRNLYTIPHPTSEKPSFPNLKGGDLANYSGYYTIPSIHPKAFLSIQAEYSNIDSLDVYGVMISFSLEGKTSKGVYFNEEGMTFENNTLSIPSEKLIIKFDRAYNKKDRSLVTISGNIGAHTVNGYTPFNPVPLEAFGGVTLTGTQMKNGQKESLTLEIVNKNEVIYNGVTMKSFVYVPLMYILAYPLDKPTIVMSFGADGEKGNSCIVTDYSVSPNTTSFVFAVHNPS